MTTQTPPYLISHNLERTRYYMGGYWTFIATSKDTKGQFSMIEINLRKGIEPPMHTHTNEDELYYVVQGELQFSVGNETFDAKSGDSIFLPRNIAHQFKLKSDTVKAVVMITPGGLEEMFWELSKPADKIDFPPMPAGPPPVEFLKRAGELQKQFGIIGIDNSKIKAS